LEGWKVKTAPLDAAASQTITSVVFIDMDHTLLEGPFETAVFPQVLGEIARQSGLEFEALLRQARQENLRRLSNPACPAVQAMDWDDIFAELAARLGAKLHASAVEIVRAHAGPPHAALHSGALQALEQLAAARPMRALVLATKGLRKYQLPVLEALGLLPFFDEIRTPDSSQALKQSLAFYGRWPRLTRVQIMVGDRYDEDVLPAHRFGFKTVWRAASPVDEIPAGESVRPDAVITSLGELPGVVERLEGERLEHDY
jgi:FMN phosphatase YigB (HAD superfamily)